MAESNTQMTLVTSPVFLQRVQYLAVQQARVVLAETGVGTTHAARATYAKSVVASPASRAAEASVMLVGGTNLIGPAISGTSPNVDSAVTDAALLAQIATFWNALAGIDTGT